MKSILSEIVLLMLALPLLVLADVSVSPLFCDHAVLAKSERTPIFGRAEAGEEVSVQLGEVLGKTTTGEDGKWRVNFDLSQVGEGPFELVIQGKNTLKYQFLFSCKKNTRIRNYFRNFVPNFREKP